MEDYKCVVEFIKDEDVNGNDWEAVSINRGLVQGWVALLPAVVLRPLLQIALKSWNQFLTNSGGQAWWASNSAMVFYCNCQLTLACREERGGTDEMNNKIPFSVFRFQNGWGHPDYSRVVVRWPALGQHPKALIVWIVCGSNRR